MTDPKDLLKKNLRAARDAMPTEMTAALAWSTLGRLYMDLHNTAPADDEAEYREMAIYCGGMAGSLLTGKTGDEEPGDLEPALPLN